LPRTCNCSSAGDFPSKARIVNVGFDFGFDGGSCGLYAPLEFATKTTCIGGDFDERIANYGQG
jgi:hypothetical protein